MEKIIQTLLKGFLKLVLWFLPKRARNMVCIISLTQYVHGNEALNDDTLRSINEVMNFGFSASAARFPASISKAIWRTADPDAVCAEGKLCVYRELDQQDLDSVIKIARKGNSSWNLYHDDSELQQHLEVLFRHNRSKVFSQA